MSEKISTLILKVDLQCAICSKKIRKVLGRLQDRENFQSVVYNEKENKVILLGPFDPKKLSKKLCCKACKVIMDIEIKQNKPELPPPPPPKPTPPPPPPTPPPPEAEPQPEPSPTPPPPVHEPKTEPLKPDRPYPCPYPYSYPYPYPYPYPTVWPFIPVCGCQGRCNCKSAEEPPPEPPVPPVVATCTTPCYDGCRTCQFICEDEPSSCSII